MNVLIANWRDSSHPAAGGAEIFTEEIGKRLVKFGDNVTIFASAFDGCEKENLQYGMRIIRDGGKYTVYGKAKEFVKHNASDYDIIVDEINTIPFRIPKIAKNKPVVALIHQLAREIWFYETRFPVNILGYYALEPLWLRAYRQIPTMVVSESTKTDLLKIGFRNVQIVPPGILVEPLTAVPQKGPHPVLMFLGRLVRSKCPNHAILAFERVRLAFPSAELWIVGEGYLREKLQRHAGRGVKFFGKATNELKFELLKRANVLLVPSVREGWANTVIESNAMGTPAVGYSVSGLKDSILHEVTGLLVRPMDYQAMAEAAQRILSDSSLANKFSENGLRWSRRFNWDQAAKGFHGFMAEAVDTFGSTF